MHWLDNNKVVRHAMYVFLCVGSADCVRKCSLGLAYLLWEMKWWRHVVWVVLKDQGLNLQCGVVWSEASRAAPSIIKLICRKATSGRNK